MKPSPFLGKILKALRAQAALGGLEISDLALHFVSFENGKWNLLSENLPLGIIKEGEIKDHVQFVEALRRLRGKILGARSGSKRMVNAAVSLSSLGIYSQVFTLPLVGGENLERAVQLNLQMASPSELS